MYQARQDAFVEARIAPDRDLVQVAHPIVVVVRIAHVAQAVVVEIRLCGIRDADAIIGPIGNAVGVGHGVFDPQPRYDQVVDAQELGPVALGDRRRGKHGLGLALDDDRRRRRELRRGRRQSSGLAGVEATVGTSSIVGFLYFITIPLLVGFVTWSSLHLLLVLDLGNRVANIVMLGLAVLVSASVITAVGIVAAASFKELLST